MLDRQLDALQVADSERLFEDRASGAASDRPNLTTCLDYPRCNAVLVVLELDRVDHLVGELISLIDELGELGIESRALNSRTDTATSAGRAFPPIQAAFAAMEGNVIRQRVREGTIAARACERKGRRSRIMTAEKLRYAQRLRAGPARSIRLPSSRSGPQPWASAMAARERRRQDAECNGETSQSSEHVRRLPLGAADCHVPTA